MKNMIVEYIPFYSYKNEGFLQTNLAEVPLWQRDSQESLNGISGQRFSEKWFECLLTL